MRPALARVVGLRTFYLDQFNQFRSAGVVFYEVLPVQ